MHKTMKDRKGVITDETEILIYAMKAKEKKKDDDKIFDYQSKDLTNMLNRFLKSNGFNHTTHDFRHGAITELFDKGIDVKTV
jgi:hypothetical protein